MKILKRIVIGILILLILLSGILYFYRDALIQKIVSKINHDYNIEMAYNDVSISIFKNFPDATLTIDDLIIKNEKPFEGDTLVAVKKALLTLNIKDAFSTNIDKIRVKNLLLDEASVWLKIDSSGNANYDIHSVIPSNSSNTNSNSKPFTFAIKEYAFTHSNFVFKDKTNNFLIRLENLNHSGSGDFSADISDLKTNSTVEKFTLKYGDIAYINQAKIKLKALIKMNLAEMKFTLKDNDLNINDLHLNLGGYVQHYPDKEDINLSFNAPKTNFKSVLSLIPNAYSTDFKNVKTSGIANINGFVKGIYSDTKMPKYNIAIVTKNASFKYPNLPKSIKNISFNGSIANQSENHSPILHINTMQFSIDQDTFQTNGTISNLIENPTVDAFFKGKLNLDNFYQAYPIHLENKISGILEADFHTKLDQKSIKNNDYKNIKTNGKASLNNFSYQDKELKNPFYVQKAGIDFNTNTIKLTEFKAKTGASDVQATGTLDNLYAFLFDDKKLKGNFNMTSNNFVVSDFLMEETADSNTKNPSDTTENLKIPDFLDITTKAKAKRVVYSNLVLEEVSTLMKIKDQKAILTDTKAKMMQGQVQFNGMVDTKTSPSKFNFDLDLNKLDIAKSFSEIETFQKLAPIANALKGKFNSDFNISGKLQKDFTPDLLSLSGKVLAQVFVKDINDKANPLFTALTSKLDFIDLKKINFNKIKASLQFKDGKVQVKPFDVKYKDITMHISGSHSFDQTLLYHINMDLPAKYLGTKAQTLLAKLTNEDKDTIKVPLYTFIQGTFKKPIVKANFDQAIKNLAVKVLQYQKQKLINQASNQVENTVEDILNDTGLKDIIPIKKDSTKNENTDVIKEGVSNVLNNLFNKKKKDTTK